MAKKMREKRGSTESSRYFKAVNEISLNPLETSASWIYQRLKRAEEPVVIHGSFAGRPDLEVSSEVGKLLDLLNSDIWLKHCILTTEGKQIVFANGSRVYFD